MRRLGLKWLFRPLNLWLVVALTVRCSGIALFTRQMTAAAVSPLTKRQFPFVVVCSVVIVVRLPMCLRIVLPLHDREVEFVLPGRFVVSQQDAGRIAALSGVSEVIES